MVKIFPSKTSYRCSQLANYKGVLFFMIGFFMSRTFDMIMLKGNSDSLTKISHDETLKVNSDHVKILGVEDPTKSKCETDYWERKKKEEGVLQNKHYETFFTKYFELTKEFYTDKKVLDIGCGPRGSLEWMKDAKSRICVDPLAHTYGDLGSYSHDMLYVFSGAENIPFPSQSFDVVTSINNLDHVTDVDASVKEIARLVRVGGHFLLIVELHTKPKPCEPQAISSDLEKDFEKLGFEVTWKKRAEYSKPSCTIRGTAALHDCPEFDVKNKEKRPSFLGLVMKKVK